MDGCERTLVLGKAAVNTVTSLMPTLEGMFLASVLDGKQGKILFRYHESFSGEVDAFITHLQALHGCEPSEPTSLNPAE